MFEQKNKIYVGNLDYSVTTDELKKFIDDKGIATKSVEVITDKYTGRSKGFGFAEVESDEAVDKAVEALNGQDLKGRSLRVSKARKPEERRDRKGGGGFGGGGRGRGGGFGGGNRDRGPRY